MVKQLEALVHKFERATKARKLSTLLYEDPDAVVGLNDDERDQLKSLNQRIKEKPDIPMPEGYLKVKERVPVYDYSVPKFA